MALPSSSETLFEVRNTRALVIAGKRFEITVSEDNGAAWRWRIAAPGELALSGEAASEMQALDAACRAGKVLARRGTA
jgi:hypothetical protein